MSDLIAQGAEPQQRWRRALPPDREVVVGRAAGNWATPWDEHISRRHAELRARPEGTYEIVDLGSHNGTYLNGTPVDRAPVTPGDIVGIGHSAFCLVGDELQEYVDTGEVSLDVQELTVAVDRGRKTLLDGVSFPVGEKCLLAAEFECVDRKINCPFCKLVLARS